jgi:nitroimidazol reductase NimA-like FMN-containing flavoprotein (pyridoxamine 5'-phosphate oxidase superfamily)
MTPTFPQERDVLPRDGGIARIPTRRADGEDGHGRLRSAFPVIDVACAERHDRHGKRIAMNDRTSPAVVEELDAAECLELITPGGIGRVGFNTSGGPVVLPVNYTVHDGAVLFRTAFGGLMDEDLSTGIRGVELKIAFEVDHVDEATREGWSVLIQGAAHRISSEEELAAVQRADLEPWAGGERRLYISVTPVQITGRRIRH